MGRCGNSHHSPANRKKRDIWPKLSPGHEVSEEVFIKTGTIQDVSLEKQPMDKCNSFEFSERKFGAITRSPGSGQDGGTVEFRLTSPLEKDPGVNSHR